MDDLCLEAEVSSTVYHLTPLSHKMYRSASVRGFGGAESGYFICISFRDRPEAGLEILAKTADFTAGVAIFEALVERHKSALGALERDLAAG